MSVLDRSALEDSPLADLHAIASELGLDGFRRLRKAELIDAILARQGGGEEDTETPDQADQAQERPRRRRRRGGRGRGRAAAEAEEAEEEPSGGEPEEEEAEAEPEGG